MSKLPNENKLGSGQKLYNQAKKSYQMVHCFSQKAGKFLPNAWPTYYSKAKGCQIWI